MNTYLAIKQDGIMPIRADGDRAMLVKVKELIGLRPTSKLTRKEFREAGFLSVTLGRTQVFPHVKFRVRTPKKEHRRHPRLALKLAA